MSATVTYKGNTLTTATNQTRVLETAGTYLEDDITIVDVTATPTGTLSITTNGTHDITNYASAAVAVPWIWESPSPLEFVKTCHDSKFKLNATTYDSWTASTTAGKILDSASATSTFTADIANYDYLIKWRYQIVPVYTSGATLKAMPIQESQIMYQFITRRPSNVANMGSETYNYNVCLSLYTIPYLEYYNTSGAASVTFSTSYGIYGSVQAAALSSTSADSITVTPKTPQINARCNSSYFATGRKAQIDSANTYIREICDVYKLDRPSAYRSMVAEMIDLRNNPIIT